jgi:hypothetical protein
MRGAGGGRPRKPPGQARHRNPPTRDTITVAADARVEDPPPPMIPLNGPARYLWEAMWQHPVATLWTVADVAPLTRLVMLQTSATAIVSKDLLAEMRHLEDRFLLNPYARAQQRVVIGDGPDDATAADVPDLDEYRRRALGQA